MEKSKALRKNPCWFRNKCSGSACLTSFESFSKVAIALPKSFSNCAVRNSVFSIQITVLSLIYSRKLSRFSLMNLFSRLGIMVILVCFSTESCVATSNVRMLSTSLPKNSIRYGLSLENEKTSRIPPRTENSPGSVIKSTRLNSYSNNTSLIKSIVTFSPTETFNVFFSSSFRVTTFSNNASGYVTITAGFLRELIRFNTSERNKILALSVSSIWYGRRYELG